MQFPLVFKGVFRSSVIKKRILSRFFQVLITLDRLAMVRDRPQAVAFIRGYEPPIRYLKDILLAFIAVQINFQPEIERKNYKKDYMHLLLMLNLENEHSALFKASKAGLTALEKWDEKAFEKEKQFRNKYYAQNQVAYDIALR